MQERCKRVVTQGEPHIDQLALVALYARGGPVSSPPPRTHADAVALALAASDCDRDGACAVLRKAGFWLEASLLAEPYLWEWAAHKWGAGQVLTLVCPEYPLAWRQRLKLCAPVVTWCLGALPRAPYVGVVGSRSPLRRHAWFADAIAAEAVRLGYSLVSGGAIGIDSDARRGALKAGGNALSILPYGLKCALARKGEALASVCAPASTFTSRQAMERNALIYALADATVVIQPRFRQGGSWHGAVDALRRNLGRVFVTPCLSSDSSQIQAVDALVALGAELLEDASQLAAILAQPPARPSLLDSLAS